MLAADVAERRGCLPAEKAAELVAALRRLPDQAARAIELAAVTRTDCRAATPRPARITCYIGRSFGYPAALEAGALKIKEISYLHAEGYAAGRAQARPISLLDAE